MSTAESQVWCCVWTGSLTCSSLICHKIIHTCKCLLTSRIWQWKDCGELMHVIDFYSCLASERSLQGISLINSLCGVCVNRQTTVIAIFANTTTMGLVLLTAYPYMVTSSVIIIWICMLDCRYTVCVFTSWNRENPVASASVALWPLGGTSLEQKLYHCHCLIVLKQLWLSISVKVSWLQPQEDALALGRIPRQRGNVLETVWDIKFYEALHLID